WTLHEEIFSAEQCVWCVTRAWAPDVAYRDGCYYLYYYFRNDDGMPGGIGVAVSDRPQGPFTNVTEDGPLVDGHDPSVFIDDDGQAYLYMGHVVYFLADDMVRIQQEAGRHKSRIVELRGHDPVGGWEAVWVFERE
ncbi:MAG: family 43 glycosylhydrolase, partial [Gemmatimonadetes bacterium]|nr:family 43 glycosylhydrolase [Gemmatimonadota bacterium]NIR79666.1 family 43 glycosylhydrolase [Gemmatimonadota bacterium]NIT88373.1 family 43 glycosylhydrolase [Gemmatimonadota bacterium]NIU32184.1 family 43 glycosylhydrolase [Gemmatimonadota bacterium]NIU36738.1 family 43 glycosylhydrolase [Gemmatimonadota bacterium]